jgi:hypothetical protein
MAAANHPVRIRAARINDEIGTSMFIANLAMKMGQAYPQNIRLQVERFYDGKTAAPSARRWQMRSAG